MVWHVGDLCSGIMVIAHVDGVLTVCKRLCKQFFCIAYLILSSSCRDTGTVNFLLLFTDWKRDSMHILFVSGRNKRKTQLTLALRPSFQLYCISVAGVWPQETSQWDGGRDSKGRLGTDSGKVQKHHPISVTVSHSLLARGLPCGPQCWLPPGGPCSDRRAGPTRDSELCTFPPSCDIALFNLPRAAEPSTVLSANVVEWEHRNAVSSL